MKKGIAFAILAAALYAVNAPFSKILLDCIPPTLMAGFLYVGAGIGMIIIALVRKIRKTETNELKLTKSELPYTVAMILLDIAAPICLMFGLNATTAANASLLNNFEIVATAIIALMIFKEKISQRLWFGILFITVSCGILSFEDTQTLKREYQVCNLRTARCLYFLPPSVGDLKTTVQENYLQKTRFKSFYLKVFFQA